MFKVQIRTEAGWVDVPGWHVTEADASNACRVKTDRTGLPCRVRGANA